MKIFINEQEFEGKLEGEKNIGQVYEGIREWAESHNKYVLSCHVNGNEMNKSELDVLDLGKAERVDFFIGEEIDVLKSGLEEVDAYIDTVGNTLFGRDSLTDAEKKDLSEGIEWTVAFLESVQKVLKLDYSSIKPMGRGKTMIMLLEDLQVKGESADSLSGIEDFLEVLRDIKLFLMDLMARTGVLLLSEAELVGVLEEYLATQDEFKKGFSRVNELYQSGRDMEAVEQLTDASARLNVVLTSIISLEGKKQLDFENITVGDETFREKLNMLYDTLSRIAVALEEEDIISAGDILEYELPEVFDEILPAVEEIVRMTKQT